MRKRKRLCKDQGQDHFDPEAPLQGADLNLGGDVQVNEKKSWQELLREFCKKPQPEILEFHVDDQFDDRLILFLDELTVPAPEVWAAINAMLGNQPQLEVDRGLPR